MKNISGSSPAAATRVYGTLTLTTCGSLCLLIVWSTSPCQPYKESKLEFTCTPSGIAKLELLCIIIVFHETYQGKAYTLIDKFA